MISFLLSFFRPLLCLLLTLGEIFVATQPHTDDIAVGELTTFLVKQSTSVGSRFWAFEQRFCYPFRVS